MSLVVLLLACASRPPPVVEALPDPVPAGPFVPVDGEAEPPEGARVPPLAGAVSELQLEGLKQVRTTFELEIDLSVLAAVPPDRLRAQLAADPDWRSVPAEGGTVALWRGEGADGWGGYVLADDGAFRAAVRFGPPSAPWAASEHVSRHPVEESGLALRAFRLVEPGWEGHEAIAARLEAGEVALELHEVASSLELEATASLLEHLPSALQCLVDLEGMVGPNGVVPMCLPDGEPASGEPSLEVRAGDGVSEVVGRLNPGAAGWTWVRLRDSSGALLHEEWIARATVERVGWSDDPAELYLLQAHVPMVIPGEVVPEAWFLEDGAAEPVRIHPPSEPAVEEPEEDGEDDPGAGPEPGAPADG